MSSREEFEKFWRAEMNVEVMDLARTNYPMTDDDKQQYKCHETNRAWITWQSARVVPPGYAIVPVEATAEMIEAAEEAYMPFGAMELAYAAMLAAAPKELVAAAQQGR